MCLLRFGRGTTRRKEGPIMECHLCRYNQAVQEGQYLGVPYADTPCGNCDLTESSSHTLPFNDEVLHPTLEHTSDDGSTLPVYVLDEFLAGLMQMTPLMRDTVCLRAGGFTNDEISQKMSVTRHTIVLRI